MILGAAFDIWLAWSVRRLVVLLAEAVKQNGAVTADQDRGWRATRSAAFHVTGSELSAKASSTPIDMVRRYAWM